jgi:hypothetical protein
MPLPNVTVDSVVLDWPCESPKECSYNGHCHNNLDAKLSTCRCFARCGELKLLPVNKSKWGFRDTTITTMNERSKNLSTWGAPFLWDESTQQWHGWASEMVNECGINVWNVNSQIVHIVSNDSTGPFHKVDVFARPFAHEPSVKRGPNGEWVMLYSAYNDITQSHSTFHKGYNSSTTNEWKHVVCTNCSQGACLSPVNSSGCPFQRGKPESLNHPYIQMMSIASTPYGPWKHVEISPLSAGWDWNTALTIHRDGSAVALIRGGMVWHAADYANPKTWHPVNGKGADAENKHEQSPEWSVSVEDPFIWQDTNGIYHALAHCFSPFYGVHAYVDPESGVPKDFFNELMNWTVTGVAYGNKVEFTDGTIFEFSRRERPHLIFYDNRPVALSNGVAYGSNPYATGQDMTTTLIQSIDLRPSPLSPHIIKGTPHIITNKLK